MRKEDNFLLLVFIFEAAIAMYPVSNQMRTLGDVFIISLGYLTQPINVNFRVNYYSFFFFCLVLLSSMLKQMALLSFQR